MTTQHITYKEAWGRLKDAVEATYEMAKEDREDACKGGHDPGPPTLYYSHLLGLMDKLEKELA